MKFHKTKLPGVIVIEPLVFEDGRGFFFESYSKKYFAKNGIVVDFVQDNHSVSAKGVLRGLHFQAGPMEQAKLVRVIKGEVFDVVVDLRKNSKTFGKFVTNILSVKNKKMIFIPSGFAHGFLSLQNGTEFLYKVSKPYSSSHERGILWSDPALGIPWPKLGKPYAVSKKDKLHPGIFFKVS